MRRTYKAEVRVVFEEVIFDAAAFTATELPALKGSVHVCSRLSVCFAMFTDLRSCWCSASRILRASTSRLREASATCRFNSRRYSSCRARRPPRFSASSCASRGTRGRGKFREVANAALVCRWEFFRMIGGGISRSSLMLPAYVRVATTRTEAASWQPRTLRVLKMTSQRNRDKSTIVCTTVFHRGDAPDDAQYLWPVGGIHASKRLIP